MRGNHLAFLGTGKNCGDRLTAGISFKYSWISTKVTLARPYPTFDPSFGNPATMDFDRVIHGVRGKVCAIGPLNCPHHHPYLSEDACVS